MTTNSLSHAPELRTLWLGAERFVIPVEVDAEAPADDSSQLWFQLETVDFERDIMA
jgi:hypothetical protein